MNLRRALRAIPAVVAGLVLSASILSAPTTAHAAPVAARADEPEVIGTGHPYLWWSCSAGEVTLDFAIPKVQFSGGPVGFTVNGVSTTVDTLPPGSYGGGGDAEGNPIRGVSFERITTFDVAPLPASYTVTFWFGAPSSTMGPWSFTFSDCPSFADVPAGVPFFNEIEWMATQGISKGYVEPNGSTTYRPLEDVSRQAMAAFLYRYSGETFTPPANPSFSDVPKDHPFYTAIEWMKARGISTGNADGTYAPLEPVTRQAMAAFLARLDGGTLPPASASSFSDVPISNPFAAQIQWMKESAISTGYADGTFHPVEPVSRQAMAAFLYRFDSHAD